MEFHVGSCIFTPNFLEKLLAAAVAPMEHTSFPICAFFLGEYTFCSFLDLEQTDLSTSRFAPIIADAGSTLAKGPVGSGKGSLRLKYSSNDIW